MRLWDKRPSAEVGCKMPWVSSILQIVETGREAQWFFPIVSLRHRLERHASTERPRRDTNI